MKRITRIWLALVFLSLAIAAGCLAFMSNGAAAEPASPAHVSPPSGSPALAEGVDLDVTYINRSPLYQAYCVDYPWDIPGQPGIPFLCPGTEDDPRWPATGELVTFTAHIVNKGTAASPAFDYAWHIDVVKVGRGTLPALAPGEEATATYQWPWGHEMSPNGQRALGDHRVRFTADPANAIPETFESNNSLEDPTNAMSFRFYFTQAMYAAYNIPVDPQWPASAEDWIQKQMATMNWDLANSTYPVAPEGATVRVRIDLIGVSDTLPPGEGHDGGWFIDADYRHGASAWYDPATDIDWALIHEMSHQVSIIDLYQIGAEAPNVLVTDRLGNPLNVGFAWARPDLMGGGDIWPHTDWHLYSSHVAGGASTYEGYRNGYCGSYLFDIPLENSFLVLDSQGSPAPGVEVSLYQRNGEPDWVGARAFDGPPDITGTTDANGLVLLTNRSANGGTVTANGHVLHDNPFGVIDIIGSQNLFLVQLRQGTHEEYRWLDITEVNLAYWMGDTDSHTFTINSHVPPAGAPEAPALDGVQVQGDWARICWQDSPSPGVTGYRLYRATAPVSEYELVAEVAAGPCLEDSYGAGTYGGKVYAVTAMAGGLESGFSNFGWAPTQSNPAALVLGPDGRRTILDPRNGYALIRQAAGGAYRQYVGSVHFHLENSQFVAMDANDRLLFSHPGDAYEARHSVRVADQDGTPLLEFGEQGSGPGQFQTPAGVAGWGEACSYGGPYEVDEHTLLLLHLNGSYDGEQGEAGTPDGTTFAEGRYGQGMLVDESDTLTYPAAGNIAAGQGTVEFWLRPDWDGDDAGNHTLFWWGGDPSGWFHLRKDPISNLVFDRFYPGGSCGAPHGVADWQAGDWHHLAFTWEGTEMALYEDGVEVARTLCTGFPDPSASSFYIGSGVGGDLAVDAVIDELRISDVPRIGNSLTCGRILVADSGNHRVQAFDSLGNFLSEFGSYGSGDGQFCDPQGLAVNPAGRVIVVDRGNNRLVVLSFDGQEFGYLGAYTAGFSEPTGVAVDTWGNMAVADTGNNRVVFLSPEGESLAEYTEPNDGYSGAFSWPKGVAVDRGCDLVIADTGNQRVVAVHGALPGCQRIWLPLALRAR